MRRNRLFLVTAVLLISFSSCEKPQVIPPWPDDSQTTAPLSGDGADDFKSFLVQVKELINKGEFGRLYDYYSPSRVRSRISKKDYLKKSAGLYTDAKKEGYSRVIDTMLAYAAGQQGLVTPARVSPDYCIYRVKPEDSGSYQLVAQKEDGNWVLHEIVLHSP